MKQQKDINILLVEDNRGDVVLIKESFKEISLGFKLNVVEDGEEAVSYIEKRGKYSGIDTPDIVILDLKLPKKDGFEVLREIRENNEVSGMPVIILSSSDLERDIEQAYRLKANFYITKGFGVENYIEIARYIEEYWFKTVRSSAAQ